MKFKTKVIGTFFIILLAVIFLSVFTIIKANGSRIRADFIKSEISVSMSEMNRIKMDVIQIQQWLTDVAVTGNIDGFDNAEGYYNNANILLDRDIQRKKEIGKADLEKILKDIKIQMQNYYELGTGMAHQYIDNGREAGNEWMDKFDPVAVELLEAVDKQKEGYTKVFEVYLTQLSDNQNMIIQILIFISIVVILIIIFMGVYIYTSLNKGMQLISEFSLKITNNNIFFIYSPLKL